MLATRHRKPPAWCVLVLLLAVAAGTLTYIRPAAAAAPTSAPGITAPAAGLTTGVNPVLSWTAVPGAIAYDVQVSRTGDFSGTLLLSSSTANLHSVPTTDLPAGQLHWRVRGKDAAGAAGPWAQSSFTRQTLDRPVLSAPVGAAPLAYPASPTVFSWGAVSGAATYRIEVDDSDDFVSPVLATETPTTSFTMTEPQTVGQAFSWRVQAVSAGGVNSDWSQVGSYSTSWQATPTLVSPSNDELVTDVVLRWDPVPGAAAYELEVSPNGDWANNTSIKTVVKGVQYSPPVTLDNASYFWRVRAVDAASSANKGAWSEVGQFTREWSPVPTLLAPQDRDYLVGQPTFSWTPVSHASRYELQVGGDANFSPGSYLTCTTDHTSYTPYSTPPPFFLPAPCDVDLGRTYYWRVRGLDDPKTPSPVLGRWSDTHSFLYRKPLPVMTGPADGVVTNRPVLTWDAVPDAEQYVVTIVKENGTVVETRTTWALSYSPLVALVAADGPFSWYVTTKDLNGDPGLIPPRSSWRSFELVAPADAGATPEPLSVLPAAGSARMPSLRWTPVAGAASYTVNYLANGVYTVLQANVPFVALTDPDKPLPTGEYAWYVEAFARGGAYLARSNSESTFSITAPSLATYTGPCAVGAVCATQQDTPTLRWQSVDEAGYYLVYVALDPYFTNIQKQYRTQYTELTPRESFLDNQAGQSYYWFVRACTGGNCAPFGEQQYDTAATFRKRSAPVTGLTAARTDVFPFMTTLRWDDYLTAKNYRVQVSTVSDFATVLDDVTVDQTTYAPWTKTYPVGPLYARVQAIDGSGNLLTSSDRPCTTGSAVLCPLRFERASRAPGMLRPSVGQEVEGVPYFQWVPQHFAAKYDVEVYRNGDTLASPVNRVLSRQTKLAAWSPTVGLPFGTYAWRVRAVDLDGRANNWSAPTTFLLQPAAVALTSPADGTTVTRSLLLSWRPVLGAARYRVETSASSAFITVATTTDTVAPAYAPPVLPADGTWFWRVKSLDAAGNVLSVSAVRSFRKDATAPTVTGLLPTSSPSVTEAWTVTFSEPVGGVSSTSMTLRAGTALVVGTVRQTSATSATFTPTSPLVPGETYALSVSSEVTDTSGNRLVPFTRSLRTSLVIDDASLAMRQTWDSDTSSAASGGRYAATRQAGTQATFTFTGTSVGLRGMRMADGGYASVYLDGVLQPTLSFYSTTTQHQVALWSRSGLSSGRHTVVLRASGSKPAASKGTWVRLDSFSVGSVRYEESSPSVRMQFSRLTSSSSLAGGSARQSHVAAGDTGARPTYALSFHGTGFTWYGARGTWAGKASVVIDGVVRGTVDTWAASTSYRSIVWSSPSLANTRHTVQIIVLGSRRSGATGYDVSVDSITVR